MDEFEKIVRSKERLEVQGKNQEEGINFDKTFILVAWLEAIRMLLTFACLRDFKLFQIDVKTFLNGFTFILEEVYVENFLNFKNENILNHIFKLSKALYDLKQAQRAWYERLIKFLIDKIF